MSVSGYRQFFSVFGGKVQCYRSDIAIDGDVYMERWILRTPLGDLRLHHILRSDNDRALHDHPFDFTSIMLWGSYLEWMESTKTFPLDISLEFNGVSLVPQTRSMSEGILHHAPCVIRHKAEDLHRLEVDTPVWTLVIAGPRRREWGFKTLVNGWVPHTAYKGEI